MTLTQKDEIVRTTVTFPEGLWQRTRHTALAKKTTAQQLVIDGLSAHLDKLAAEDSKAAAKKKA